MINSNYVIIFLQIRVGRNIIFPPNGTTGPEWTLEYTSGADSTQIAIIAGASVAGAILLLFLLLLLLIIPIAFYMRRQSRKKDLRFTHLLSQMETMELEMADQCKQGNGVLLFIIHILIDYY